MSPKRQELVLESGVLAFDGDVLEAFGFTDGGSQRLPVSQLKQIDLSGGNVTLRLHGSNLMAVTLSLSGGEAESAGLNGLLDEVRAKAPNLEE